MANVQEELFVCFRRFTLWVSTHLVCFSMRFSMISMHCFVHELTANGLINAFTMGYCQFLILPFCSLRANSHIEFHAINTVFPLIAAVSDATIVKINPFIFILDTN